MEENLIVSVSPHVYAKHTTQSIMRDVVIALVPASIAAIIIFGPRSIAVIAACIISCVGFEALFNVIMKKKQTIADLSAVVTGLLLALNLPVSIPIWQAVIGSFAAVVVVKGLFGGLGYNFANPAITGRIIMLIAFTDTMTAAAMPRFTNVVDCVASATPLAELAVNGKTSVSLLNMFLGVRGGALGETCALALLIGGIYLIARGVITWHTPVAFLGSVFLLSLLYTGSPETALVYLLSGGVFIGAFFMATDYVTTPTTPLGQLIFGLGCGCITCLIRFWGSYPEGVSFSILIMNILTPYIEKATMHKPFGGVKK
jgi:electron transport complex protein RnfD